jgi:hypothetical protein
MPKMQDISRRELFAAAAAAGAALVAPEAANAGAFPPNVVQYKTTAGDAGHQCRSCKLFVPNASAAAAGSCKSVSGEISPDGWCKLWTDQLT